MDLFSIFHKKEIQLQAGKDLKVEYLNCKEIREILPVCGEDLLLIKKNIDMDDVEYINSFTGDITIRTEMSNSLESFDAIKKIGPGCDYMVTENICLNYIHTNETLFVFSDEGISSVPNVLKIYPMKREDVSFLYSEIESIPDSISTNPDNSVIDNSDNSDLQEKAESKSPKEEDDNKRQKPKEEIEKNLILDKIQNLFNQNYVDISVKIEGSAVERKTISLNEFYKKHNISSGRLKGSWVIFDKHEASKYIEQGITKKAMKPIEDKYSLVIENYGKIIKKNTLDEFMKQVDSIINDYKEYLKGKNEKKIGDVTIHTKFNCSDPLDKTCEDLRNYLMNICPYEGAAGEKMYGCTVDEFIDEVKEKYCDFSSDVKSITKYVNYPLEQWENEDFIRKFIKCVRGDKKGFFQPELIELIDRYENIGKP